MQSCNCLNRKFSILDNVSKTLKMYLRQSCYDRKRLRLTASFLIGSVRAVSVIITHPCQRHTLAHCPSTRELLRSTYPLLWNTQHSSINNTEGHTWTKQGENTWYAYIVNLYQVSSQIISSIPHHNFS